ncbi:MAG: C4-dicarboxylate ABC transporter [Betaproteobacteria bacterium]
MLAKVVIILLVMVAAYIVAKAAAKLSVELSIFIAAVAAAFAAGVWFPARHIAEGSITYLDLCLIFFTATVFMNIMKEAGAVDYAVRAIVKRFQNNRPLALILIMLIMLIPGALTGAGSVSVLVVGGTVASALSLMGISAERVAAIVFFLAGLSAVAPPVNVWAMMTCAGTAIPYVGFEVPLGLSVLVLGVFTVFTLGLKRSETSSRSVVSQLPEVPKGMTPGRVITPFVVLFGLIAASRIWPYSMPILGLPLIFSISAVVALLVSPKRINVIELSRSTLHQLLPLLATCTVVGTLIQIMTATGVRGLLSLAVICMPMVLIYCLLPIIIPISEGVLTFGGAAVLGIPLIWTFNAIGLDPVIALSGLSLLWFLGDALPPTAIIARLVFQTVGYKGSYATFMKTSWLPWVATAAVGTLMVVFSKALTFLVL